MAEQQGFYNHVRPLSVLFVVSVLRTCAAQSLGHWQPSDDSSTQGSDHHTSPWRRSLCEMCRTVTALLLCPLKQSPIHTLPCTPGSRPGMPRSFPTVCTHNMCGDAVSPKVLCHNVCWIFSVGPSLTLYRIHQRRVSKCQILPIPASLKMPIKAIEPAPTLRLHSCPMSASRLYAASPSDAPSTKSGELGLRARQSKRHLRRAPRPDEITSSQD